jgi:microcystin-dependent protein
MNGNTVEQRQVSNDPKYDRDIVPKAYLDRIVAAITASIASVDSVPIGAGTWFVSDTIPAKWLLCNGQAVSRTTYATLFAMIGTTYGAGDSSTTFNIPNIKGRVVVGKNSADTAFDTLSETGGAPTVTLTAAQSGLVGHNHTQDAHSHTVRYRGFSITPNSAGSFVLRRTDAGDAYDGTDTDAANLTTATNQAIASAAASQSHTNLQPYIVENYIIKAL